MKPGSTKHLPIYYARLKAYEDAGNAEMVRIEKALIARLEASK